MQHGACFIFRPSSIPLTAATLHLEAVGDDEQAVVRQDQEEEAGERAQGARVEEVVEGRAVCFLCELCACCVVVGSK